MAIGSNGQYIFIHPEHELVVVFTSNFSENVENRPHIFFEHFILPSIKSSMALPANLAGVELLQTKILQAAINNQVGKFIYARSHVAYDPD